MSQKEEKKKIPRIISIKSKSVSVTPNTTPKQPKVVDEFDDFLNSKLEEEQDKELEKLLDEATATAKKELEEKKLKEQEIEEKKENVKIEKEISKNNEKKEDQVVEDCKILSIEENGDEITLNFKQKVDKRKEKEIEEEQNKKLKAFMTKIDSEDVLENRLNLISSHLMKRFGKILDIHNDDIKSKSDVYTEQEIEELNALRPSLQNKLYTLEEMIRLLGNTLEKSIRRSANHRKEKKQLKELYLEKEEQYKECKQEIEKLESDKSNIENDLAKMKRERDLLIQKLSKYEKVDIKEIEKESQPITESITKIFSKTNETIGNWFVKKEEEPKSTETKPNTEKGLLTSWFYK